MKEMSVEKNLGKSNLFTGSNTFDTNLLEKYRWTKMK